MIKTIFQSVLELMSIGTDHTFSSNEPKFTHYPYAYSFESSDDHSRSFGLYNYLFSRFAHEVRDLQNTRSNNWVNKQFLIHGQTVGRNQQSYMLHIRDYVENSSSSIL